MNIFALRKLAAFVRPRFARGFSTEALSMQTVVNNFYARAEVEEVTVASLSKTMSDILKTHTGVSEHKQYLPIADEVALYVVKVLQQSKKPFVSH